MAISPRLLQAVALPALVSGLVLVGCGQRPSATPSSIEPGTASGWVEDCLTQGREPADDSCGLNTDVSPTDLDSSPYTVVSLIEPGPLRDQARDAEITHGLGVGPVEGERTFTGADNDLVSTSIDDSESDLFNPAGDRFVFQVWLTLNRDQMETLRQTVQPSWNVVQRGFADSTGGQWKLSLVVTNGNIRAQCVVRDERGEVLRAHSRSQFQPDVEAAISCLVDDERNELGIVVDGEAGDRDRTTDSGDPFGDVRPHDMTSGCWADVADQLSIGNKPACGITPLTDDDRFRGAIRQVQVLKETAP